MAGSPPAPGQGGTQPDDPEEFTLALEKPALAQTSEWSSASASQSQVSERWIKIGTVRADTVLADGHRGWWINWKGRTDWCQPSEFKTFDGLAAAVRRFLSFGHADGRHRRGMEVVAFASRLPRKEYQGLWVLVRRKIESSNGLV